MTTYLQNFRKFKEFLGKEVWLLFTASVIVGILWFLVESSFIFVLQGFFRALGLVKKENTFLPDFYPTSEIGAMLALLAYGILRSIVVMMKQYFSEVTNQAFVRTQRERILEYALTNSQDVSSHVALNLFNEKVVQASSVMQFLSLFIYSFVSSILFFFLGLRLAPIELFIGIGLMGGVFFVLKFYDQRVLEAGKKLNVESKKLTEILVVGLRNHFLLKIYNLISAEVARGKKAARDYEHSYKNYIFITSIKYSAPLLAGSVVVSLMCIVSVKWIGTPGMVLLSFIYIFMRLAQSLSEAGVTMANIRFNRETLKELYHWHILYNDHQASEGRQSTDIEVATKMDEEGINYEVRNLHFNYKSDEPLFRGLNLTVKHKQILLIKGPSGSGKSTLLTLMLGLQKPKEGEIFVNGNPVGAIRNELAPRISYVGPESYLIAGTVRDNLLYANDLEGVSDEEIIEVLQKAQIKDFINSHPDGLNRRLREVTEYSTGQKQRLALARALLRKPKLLILDEATANLDFTTEKQIIDTIRDISHSMTIIAISHKESFDPISTKILNLEPLKPIKQSAIGGTNVITR